MVPFTSPLPLLSSLPPFGRRLALFTVFAWRFSFFDRDRETRYSLVLHSTQKKRFCPPPSFSSLSLSFLCFLYHNAGPPFSFLLLFFFRLLFSSGFYVSSFTIIRTLPPESVPKSEDITDPSFPNYFFLPPPPHALSLPPSSSFSFRPADGVTFSYPKLTPPIPLPMSFL